MFSPSTASSAVDIEFLKFNSSDQFVVGNTGYSTVINGSTITENGNVAIGDSSTNYTLTINGQAVTGGSVPTNHASTATTYGVGTASNYGHLKLSASVSSTSGTTGGIAATPSAVKSAYDLADSAYALASTVSSGSVNSYISYRSVGKIVTVHIYYSTAITTLNSGQWNVLGQLPTGYRPGAVVYFVGMSYSSVGTSRLFYINTSGTIYYYAQSSETSSMPIGSVTFITS